MNNPTVSVSLDVIRVCCDNQEILLNAPDIYQQLHHLITMAHIKALLAPKHYSPALIDTLVDDEFVQDWLRCNSNNSSISECEELAAIMIADEKAAKLSSTTMKDTQNRTPTVNP